MIMRGQDQAGAAAGFCRRKAIRRISGFISLVLAVVLLGACGSAPPEQRATRTVMSMHKGWTIGVTPSRAASGAWRARVHAWPKDVSPQSHEGIALHFADSASSENAIVAAAVGFARAYIDASTADRDGDSGPAAEPRQGATVVAEYNGWTMRITPSAAAAAGAVWRAGLEVWPPDRSSETQSGIQVRFTEVAADERSIVETALQSGRRYIDASRTQHQ